MLGMGAIFLVIIILILDLIFSSTRAGMMKRDLNWENEWFRKRDKYYARQKKQEAKKEAKIEKDGPPYDPVAAVDNMTYDEFVRWCGNLLTYHGFSDVVYTDASDTHGVAIAAKKGDERYAIQCGFYKKVVEAQTVKDVAAGAVLYGCRRSAVMTNGTFSPDAYVAASTYHVALWDRSKLVAMFQPVTPRPVEQKIELAPNKPPIIVNDNVEEDELLLFDEYEEDI